MAPESPLSVTADPSLPWRSAGTSSVTWIAFCTDSEPLLHEKNGLVCEMPFWSSVPTQPPRAPAPGGAKVLAGHANSSSLPGHHMSAGQRLHDASEERKKKPGWHVQEELPSTALESAGQLRRLGGVPSIPLPEQYVLAGHGLHAPSMTV
eukprot:3934708-Rhodomonas_salina.2